MAIRKNEISSNYVIEDVEIIINNNTIMNLMEDFIDMLITESWKPGAKVICTILNDGVRVSEDIEDLISNYRDAGWNINLSNSNHCGWLLTLS